jgi:hypothetical protein
MGSNHQFAIGLRQRKTQSRTAVFRDSDRVLHADARASSELHQTSPSRCVKVLATIMKPEKEGRASCIEL